MTSTIYFIIYKKKYHKNTFLSLQIFTHGRLTEQKSRN